MLVRMMMEIEIEDVNDFASIERGVTAAHRKFPSRAMQTIVERVEAIAESRDPGRLRKKSREKRVMWLTCGCAEFVRRRYTDELEDKSYLLFDLRVGLEQGVKMSRAARAMFANLASIAPSYDKARVEVELLWGESPSTTAIWTHTQREGEALAQKARAERKAVFQDGELPGADIPPKDFVGIETDSTYVDKWRAKNEHHEIYVGIAYDGKEYTGKKKERAHLTNKVAAASLDGSTIFGAEMYIAAQKKHNVSEARTVHYATDGDDALETIRQMHFYRARHHLDHRHVHSRAIDAYGHEYEASAYRLLAHIFSEKKGRFIAAIERDIRRLESRRTKLREYRDYILKRWDWIFAARKLRKENPHIKIPKKINGTGADERMVGVLVGHRMKHRGMGWTKTGAANIMHVRLRTLGLQD